jgi:hypothetical protein
LEEIQKNDWKLILEQLEQSSGTTHDLCRESMKTIFGENWARVWRGNVRKGVYPPDVSAAGLAFATLDYLAQWSEKLITLARDALGIPKHGKKED